MKITISPAKNKDFEGVFYLLDKHLWPKTKINKRKLKEIYVRQLKKKKIFLMAKINSEIVGFISLNIRLDIQIQEKIGQIEELVVKEQQRRLGIGKKLMQAVMKEAKKQKCAEIHLTSNMKRKSAHKFYKKLGFKSTAYLFWKEI